MSLGSDRTLGLESVPVLSSIANYHKWKLAIENYLLINGCLGIIEGTDIEPFRRLTDITNGVRVSVPRTVRAGSILPTAEETVSNESLDSDDEDRWNEWRKRELKAQGAIMSKVEAGLLVDLRTLKSAYDMWLFLAQDMQLATPEHRTDVERKLRTLMLRSNPTDRDMTDHLQKFNLLWLEALDSGCAFDDATRALWFLDSLPRSDFKVMRSLYVNLPTTSKTWIELRRLYQVEVADRMRMAPQAQSQRTLEINATGLIDTSRTNYRSNNRTDRTTTPDWVKEAECHYCHKKGHLSKDCRKKQRDNAKSRTKDRKGQANSVRSNESKPTPMVDPFWATSIYEATHGTAYGNPHNIAHDEDIEPEFLIDSGASHHLTPNRALLTNIVQLEEPMAFCLANPAHQVRVYEKGEILLRLPSGQGIRIQNVHYAPHARQILSANTLIRNGWTVDLMKEQLRRGKEVITMTRRGLLNFARLGRLAHNATINATIAMGPLQIEHNRLGHIGRTRILELAQAGELRSSYDDLKKDTWRTDDCAACQERKTARLPKNDISPHGTRNCEIVHSDISGPLSPSANGAQYIVTFYDDYSKVNRVVTTLDRKWILHYLQQFVAKIERQLGEKVRFVRTDGGTEYDSTSARQWYLEKGIVHQISPRYTPELNGVAERFNRTLKEMASAMLSTASLDHSYWDFAIRYASVMLMKTSTSPAGTNAWHALTGRKPGLNKAFMFGELVYAQIPVEVRSKSQLDFDKGQLARIVGQEEGMSGWVVRFEHNGQMVVSRDVRSASEYTRPTPIAREPLPSPAPIIESVHTPTQPTIEQLPEALPGPAPASHTNEPSEAPQVEHEPSPPVEAPRIEEPAVPTDPIEPPAKTREPIARVVPEPTRTSQRIRERAQGGTLSAVTWFPQNAYYNGLASEVAMILAIQGTGKVPQTADEAMQSSDRARWIEAMERELGTIQSKGTWEETTLPHDRKAIDSRWVFAIKEDADGNIVKYKARIVAKGFSQQPGIDYEETYAPVGRMVSLRILFVIAAVHDFELHQADVEGAFLNGPLEETIFMRYPDGMRRKHGCNTLRLLRALYGLKQSARVWWIELGDELAYDGFIRLESDWGMYYKPSANGEGPIIVLAYVDDMLIAAKTRTAIARLMRRLKSKWVMTEMGEIRQILGLKVVRDRAKRTIYLSQPAYIERIAEEHNVRARSYGTPLPLRPEEMFDGSADLASATPYLKIIGSLMWIASSTRPDICYATRYLARYSAKPTVAHLEMAKRVLAYLAHTKDRAIALGGDASKQHLEGWVDADHAGCTVTRKSTTGYVFKLCDSTIQWQSRRQATVAQSTMDAEYIAAAEAAREAIWLRSLLSELGFPQTTTRLNCDNESAIQLANNPGTHARSKHIDIKYHFIREKVYERVLQLSYVRSELQDADFLTKPLPRDAHDRNCARTRLVLTSTSISTLNCISFVSHTSYDMTDNRAANAAYIIEHGIVASLADSCDGCLPALMENSTIRPARECRYLPTTDNLADTLKKCAYHTRNGHTCAVRGEDTRTGNEFRERGVVRYLRTEEELAAAQRQAASARTIAPLPRTRTVTVVNATADATTDADDDLASITEEDFVAHTNARPTIARPATARPANAHASSSRATPAPPYTPAAPTTPTVTIEACDALRRAIEALSDFEAILRRAASTSS